MAGAGRRLGLEPAQPAAGKQAHLAPAARSDEQADQTLLLGALDPSTQRITVVGCEAASRRHGSDGLTISDARAAPQPARAGTAGGMVAGAAQLVPVLVCQSKRAWESAWKHLFSYRCIQSLINCKRTVGDREEVNSAILPDPTSRTPPIVSTIAVSRGSPPPEFHCMVSDDRQPAEYTSSWHIPGACFDWRGEPGRSLLVPAPGGVRRCSSFGSAWRNLLRNR
jgi:hypothetical protein